MTKQLVVLTRDRGSIIYIPLWIILHNKKLLCYGCLSPVFFIYSVMNFGRKGSSILHFLPFIIGFIRCYPFHFVDLPFLPFSTTFWLIPACSVSFIWLVISVCFLVFSLHFLTFACNLSRIQRKIRERFWAILSALFDSLEEISEKTFRKDLQAEGRTEKYDVPKKKKKSRDSELEASHLGMSCLS